MSAVTYQSLALAWQPKSKRDKPFLLFTLFIFVLSLGTGIFLSSIELPPEDPRRTVEIPDRIAKFILDKPKPRVEIKKPVIKKPIPKKPAPTVKRDQPKKPIKLTEAQEDARQNAAKSGLIALSDELADLMDTSSIDSMVGNSITRSDSSTQVASVDTQAFMAGAMEGSGGVNVENNLSSVATTTRLNAGQPSVALAMIADRAAEGSGKADSKKNTIKKPRTGNIRSEEDIAYVVDKNKGKLQSIYRRARRNNPGIMGKIVLEITILPSGKVESVRLSSSELQNAKLEARIMARVKQFNFGVQNVKKVTVTYPIVFLPT